VPVEFDEFSRDVPDADEPGGAVQAAEALPARERGNRKRIAIASAGGAVLLTGAVVAALVTSSGSASASPAALAAAASSAASSESAAKPAPKGTDGHRGGGGLGALGALAGKPILFGTVKSVRGTTILITDLQGFTRTIITSATTTYKDGLTADPAAGTKLIAVGTVASDGTDLDATTISGLPAGLGGAAGAGSGHPGFRGGPGGGPGGPGAGGSGRPFPHPTGTPPSGFHPGERPKSTVTSTPTKTA
jgi:hypothetical protein